MHPVSVILESGLAGSPVAWMPVAKLLEPEFRVVLHRRGGRRNLLPEIAEDLRGALDRAGIPRPYLLVGHSFGALVIRQFAVTYPSDTAALLFVDGLPASTEVPRGDLVRGFAAARLAQALAAAGLMGALLPALASCVRQVDWAFQELRKLPEAYRAAAFAEWTHQGFYGDLARTLSALPENLRLARTLPQNTLFRSLHSDYPDPTGQRVENAGHWIHIDQPEEVADAVRSLARAIIMHKGA